MMVLGLPAQFALGNVSILQLSTDRKEPSLLEGLRFM
jgi:hypothetical protein